MTETDKLNIDSIIARLLEGKVTVWIYQNQWNIVYIEYLNYIEMPQFLHFCFTVRGSRPGKNVQLSENEIRGLCLKSREIFLSQPILLELEAPLKICGKINIYLIQWYETVIWTPSSVHYSTCYHTYYRWHPRSILWSSKTVWIWRLSARIKLLISGRLRRPRKTKSGNNLSLIGEYQQAIIARVIYIS